MVEIPQKLEKEKDMKKIILSVLVVISVGISFVLVDNSYASSQVQQQTRTVFYEDKDVFDQSFLNDFDEYDITSDEYGSQLVAKKSFDMSILDEIDFVGLDENDEQFTVRYELAYIAEEDTVLLTVTIEGYDEIPIIETIPGLPSLNDAGEPDVMFVVDGEYLWLSDLNESALFNEVGWFSSLVKVVTKAVTDAATAVVKAIAPILKPAVRLVVNVGITILGPERAASWGAKVLNMSIDEQGIYHANFDAWQQYFGYTDLYDVVFNAATSMRSAKFEFDINNDSINDYIIWVWKGDYLNLGAGAELGIYKRWSYSDVIWIVDKSLAMTMTMQLDYKQTNIINWQPTAKQWWITGFNYNYRNINRDDLTARFSVTFNNSIMYNAFKNRWDPWDDRWDFTGGYKANFSF